MSKSTISTAKAAVFGGIAATFVVAASFGLTMKSESSKSTDVNFHQTASEALPTETTVPVVEEITTTTTTAPATIDARVTNVENRVTVIENKVTPAPTTAAPVVDSPAVSTPEPIVTTTTTRPLFNGTANARSTVQCGEGLANELLVQVTLRSIANGFELSLSSPVDPITGDVLVEVSIGGTTYSINGHKDSGAGLSATKTLNDSITNGSMSITNTTCQA